jgi:hypothetical protein
MKLAISKSGVALNEATGKYLTGRPPIYTHEELITKTRQYIDGAYEVFPSIVGLAGFLNASSKTVYEWAKENEEFRNTLDILKDASEKVIANSAMTGKFQPSFAVFYAKARLGMKENDAPQAQQVNIQVVTNGEAPQITVG